MHERRMPGLARAQRATLSRARSGEALTREAEELIFEVAERMSEGDLRPSAAGETYFGTTMITIDLAALSRRLRGSLDGTCLASLVEGSVRVHLRAMRLARADVMHRFPDREFAAAQVESQVRVVGDRLHLDLDLVLPAVAEAQRVGGST